MKVFKRHNTDCRYNDIDKFCTTITALMELAGG